MARESRTPAAKGNLIAELTERAKELNCLYRTEELLGNVDRPLADVLADLVEEIPPGWQYPEVCEARITYIDEPFETEGFEETADLLEADIVVRDETVGRISVCYLKDVPVADRGSFLKEEVKLIETIAERIGHFVLHQKLRGMFDTASSTGESRIEQGSAQWRVAIDLLRQTDRGLLFRVSRKMMNYLLWCGIDEARSLLKRYGRGLESERYLGESNQPQRKTSRETLLRLSDETFQAAAAHLSDNDILAHIRKWIHEDKSSELIKPLMSAHASLTEIADAMQRYQHFKPDGFELSDAAIDSVRVALIRRFFTDNLDYIEIAKRFVRPGDFYSLLERLVCPADSHGRLGGKSSGLFLGSRILKSMRRERPAIGEVKTPKTWYLTSDGMHEFVHYNNLEEIYEQKYKEIGEIRQEYPHLVQVFKNSHFPADIVKGLSMALDDLGEVPLIVRSSSLLEDSLGAAFSGKYRSLFLANQGNKSERLEALMDAIAEVYASTLSPDAIAYRTERRLLDFNEQMGIMIQEVVGRRVGHYFFPALAGVAFSNNEFRWSPRIKRTDGLLRMVPGLGTRAVDRLTDDYPILVAPGQPQLGVNVTPDEIIRYAPKKMDVINLERNRFETVEIAEILREHGPDYPGIGGIVSIHHDGRLKRPSGLLTDFGESETVVTFAGLISDGALLRQVKNVLGALEEALGNPVDIEFAVDGDEFHLLQCRPQSAADHGVAVSIPRDIPEHEVLFTAERYVSNGWIPDLTHLVYIRPDSYQELSGLSDLRAVGQAVGRLNKLLPKRQFALIGPGRWGSRGDIKLGVRVTYSDINNTALLVEVARKKGNYVPDLSFGTHFFQDLVESSIRYLPLYPDDDRIQFNERLLEESPNILKDVLPEFAALSDVVRVIDIARSTGGKVLRVLMNADDDEAIGMLVDPSSPVEVADDPAQLGDKQSDDHWRWRLGMVERIAAEIDPERFGVVALYVFGSVKNANAGPGSDIDLLVHFRGGAEQRRDLDTWLQGWSICLDEINYLRTGYRSDGLLDVHIITDESIERRDSFAVKIGAVTDAARCLPLGKPAG